MKIKNIELINHPVLGNLKLDFCNANGQSVDTIILAGENGVGKSVLLHDLYFLFETYPNRFANTYTAIVHFEVSESFTAALRRNIPHVNWDIKEIFAKYEILGHTQGPVANSFRVINKDNTISDIHFNIIGDLRYATRIIFSNVEINYMPSGITSVTSRNIDVDERFEISTHNTSTDIVQLLVDIKALDNEDLANWVNQNPNIAPTENNTNKRLKRFTNAFNYIFSNKKFKGIINSNGQKNVVFSENDREMSIAELSSGEKQIVFRGSFLLKNKESNKGAIVLIDEPEISLHPTWQLKILDYYKKLFQDEQGNQTSQLFVVTHSPFIIHNANRSNDKVIVLKKKDDGTIEVLDKPEYYGWTSNHLIEEAFNINSFVDNTPVVFLEGETDEKYFNTTMKVFKIQSNVSFRWIGRTHNNNAEFTGDTALNQTKSFLLANESLVQKKIVLLYDSDTNKQPETHNNVLIRKMSVNPYNTLYKIGVENLLTLPAGFNSQEYYTERNKIDDYGANSTIATLDKTALCSYICDQLQGEAQQTALSNIKNCIDGILAEL